MVQKLVQNGDKIEYMTFFLEIPGRRGRYKMDIFFNFFQKVDQFCEKLVHFWTGYFEVLDQFYSGLLD